MYLYNIWITLYGHNYNPFNQLNVSPLVSVHFAQDEEDLEFADNQHLDDEIFNPVDEQSERIRDLLRHRKPTPFSKSTKHSRFEDDSSDEEDGDEQLNEESDQNLEAAKGSSAKKKKVVISKSKENQKEHANPLTADIKPLHINFDENLSKAQENAANNS